MSVGNITQRNVSTITARRRFPVQSTMLCLFLATVLLQVGHALITRHSNLVRPPSHLGATPTLGFLSFDLDDTLFPTGKVVDQANAKMITYMQDLLTHQNQKQTERITLPAFLQTTKEIRYGLEGPITYTALRKKAIAATLEPYLSSSTDLQQVINDCYQVWETERHKAAEQYLFPDALDMLQTIQRKFPDVCIAAITNGKGNPLYMSDTLEPYFAFCVSGEDDHVFPNRKPAAGIYHVALEQYRQHAPHHDQDQHLWCHVGDCLANDVGASADCGAMAIWYNPKEEEEEEERSSSRLEGKNPSWSTASADDIQKRQQLADAAKDKAAVTVQSLSELVYAIDQLVERAAKGEPANA